MIEIIKWLLSGRQWRVEYYAIDVRPQRWEMNDATWHWTFKGAVLYAIKHSMNSKRRQWRVMNRYDSKIEIFVTLVGESKPVCRIYR